MKDAVRGFLGRQCSWVMIVIAACFGSLPVFAEPVDPESSADKNVPDLESALSVLDQGIVHPESMRTLVELAYQSLEEYTSPSGKELRLELSEFETFTPEFFPVIRWLDYVDLPVGDVIDVTRRVKELAPSGETWAYYEPSWSTRDSEILFTDEMLRLSGMSAEEVFAELSESSPHYRKVAAFTSYTVKATLGSGTRVYRAAVIWAPTGKGKETTFRVADHITQGIEQAAVEIHPVKDERSLEKLPALRTKSGATCEPSVSVNNTVKTKVGVNGHFSGGKHVSAVSFEGACECDESCASNCEATAYAPDCFDVGVPTTMCHKLASNINEKDGWNGDGHLGGASCSAGFGCVQTACLFCMCGLSVKVGFLGSQVTFTTTGDPDWQGNLEKQFNCPACEEIPPPPPPPGGGGGGPEQLEFDGDGCSGSPPCSEGEMVTVDECYNECDGVEFGNYCVWNGC